MTRKISPEAPGYFCNLISSYDVAVMPAEAVIPIPKDFTTGIRLENGSYLAEIQIPLTAEQFRAVWKDDATILEVLSWGEE